MSKVANDYFEKNVDLAVEMEAEDGHRMWIDCKGYDEASEVIKRWEDRGYCFSDEDFKAKQSDKFCSRVLALAEANWFKGDFAKNRGCKSMFDLIDIILDEDLYTIGMKRA